MNARVRVALGLLLGVQKAPSLTHNSAGFSSCQPFPHFWWIWVSKCADMCPDSVDDFRVNDLNPKLSPAWLGSLVCFASRGKPIPLDAVHQRTV